jgi:hypothetical protein
MRRGAASRRFYRVVLLISPLLLLIGAMVNLFDVSFPNHVQNLDPLQTKEFDTYVAMVQLLITLATGAAGVLIAIVFNRYQKEPLPPAQVRRALTAWALVGLSLYSGYLSYRNLLRMLDQHWFDLYKMRIWLPGWMQFWSFLASIGVVADFVIDSFRKEYEE